jgi:hypothetical protein
MLSNASVNMEIELVKNQAVILMANKTMATVTTHFCMRRFV